MSNSNITIVVFAIVGLLMFVALIGIDNNIKVNAQGANNQSFNLTSPAEENMTVEEDIVTPSLSNFTSESGTIPSLDACRELTSCVKVVSRCNISPPPDSANASKKFISCDQIVDNLFRIFPFLYKNNQLVLVGPTNGIVPAPSPGRTITYGTEENTSSSYEIEQLPATGEINDMFHIFQSGYGCKGEIKAGETKVCNINTIVYVKGSAGR